MNYKSELGILVGYVESTKGNRVYFLQESIGTVKKGYNIYTLQIYEWICQLHMLSHTHKKAEENNCRETADSQPPVRFEK